MPTIDVKITNIDQIRSAFRKAPALMVKELDIAIKKTIMQIAGQSMKNTPVLTGRLRASTYENFSPLKGTVGTNTDYDMFVHEGTRYMKARPYLRNAVEEESSETQGFFKDAVENVLNQIARET